MSLSSRRALCQSLLLGVGGVGLAHVGLAGVGTAWAEEADADKRPSAREIAYRVQGRYANVDTYRAEFRQIFRSKVHKETIESHGKVAFEKPGKMSFAYEKPSGNRVVSNGKTIRVYEKENRQMFETSLKSSPFAGSLAFLLGSGSLLDDFTIELLESTKRKIEGAHLLECTPTQATPAFQRLVLYVDAATASVDRVLILDAQANHNRFDFKNAELNKKIDDKEFELKPPAGTTIIKA